MQKKVKKAYKIIGEDWNYTEYIFDSNKSFPDEDEDVKAIYPISSDISKYEIGETYSFPKEISLAEGFHVHKRIDQCYNAYDFNDNIKGNLHVCEVEILGESIIEKDIISTDKVRIIRELSLIEIYQYFRENVKKVDWYNITRSQYLTEDIIREFQAFVDWDTLWRSQNHLSVEFILEFKGRANRFDYWSTVLLAQTKINELLEIKDFQDALQKDPAKWLFVSANKHLSLDSIEKYKDTLDWQSISRCQDLSEESTLKYADRLDWDLLSLCQRMSRKFIVENRFRIDLGNVYKNKHLSEEFKLSLLDELEISKEYTPIIKLIILNCLNKHENISRKLLSMAKDILEPESVKIFEQHLQ